MALAQRNLSRFVPESISKIQGERSRSGVMSWVLWGAGIAAMGVMLFPVVGGAIGGGISHIVDRFKNGHEASKELNLRTRFYSQQIGSTLGMDPAKVKVGDFKRAAQINPVLRRAYEEVTKKQSDENNTSLALNSGAALAGALLPGGGAGAHGIHGMKTLVEGVRGAGSMAYGLKSMAGSLAGGAIGGALAHNTLDPQQFLEALDKASEDAQRKNIPLAQVINPQMIFMLRVAQDQVTAKQIEKNFGKKLHKMEPAEIERVMNAYQPLAAAAEREAYAVVKGIMPLRDLGAAAPNLEGSFAGPMVQNQASRGSHVDRIRAQRAGNAPRAAGNDNAMNDNFTGLIDQQRVAMLAQQNGKNA